MLYLLFIRCGNACVRAVGGISQHLTHPTTPFTLKHHLTITLLVGMWANIVWTGSGNPSVKAESRPRASSAWLKRSQLVLLGLIANGRTRTPSQRCLGVPTLRKKRVFLHGWQPSNTNKTTPFHHIGATALFPTTIGFFFRGEHMHHIYKARSLKGTLKLLAQ